MTHTFFTKREVLPLFNNGKDLEIRTENRYTKKVAVGDTLVFGNTIERKVLSIRKYSDLDSMLAQEKHARIAPGINSNEIAAVLRTIYPKKQPIIVFELVKEEKTA